MASVVVLAVAGSRKTQELVERCAEMPSDKRALVVTFAQTNQLELKSRIAKFAGDRQGIVVTGWYSFLIRDFARPFIPFKFPGERVTGFNFDGRPHRMATGKRRFLDSTGAVYACELGRLAHELVSASKGALMRRLRCCYDEVLIDEVQDLSAHDWSIIDSMLESGISLYLVGDIRQAVLSTNPTSPKNKQYRNAAAVRWLREREEAGKLRIVESCITWRCRPEIARFSDTIFDESWAFPPTESRNAEITGHDGVFLLRPEHLGEYIARYEPRCLRDGANSGKRYSLDYTNFGVAKGQTYTRVLIIPTEGIVSFLQRGAYMKPKPAARFYVAVTRARQSVAILLDAPGKCELPYWTPES